VDVGGAADLLVGLEATLAVHEVRGEEGVDERRLAETSLSCVALEAVVTGGYSTLIPTQMTLNWKPRFTDFLSICLVMLSKPT
jgi:hypothetical protein